MEIGSLTRTRMKKQNIKNHNTIGKLRKQEQRTSDKQQDLDQELEFELEQEP